MLSAGRLTTNQIWKLFYSSRLAVAGHKYTYEAGLRCISNFFYVLFFIDKDKRSSPDPCLLRTCKQCRLQGMIGLIDRGAQWVYIYRQGTLDGL